MPVESGSWRDSDAGYAGGRFAMDVNAIVSYNLRAIRRQRGMTQDDVADGLARLTGHRLPQASISARGVTGKPSSRSRCGNTEKSTNPSALSLPVSGSLSS